MDTLVLQFSRWRWGERGFLKLEAAVSGVVKLGRWFRGEYSTQVVECPLRGPRANAIAVPK
jgi:hypothetical protein